MKKSILIFGIILTSFSLMAFAVINWNVSSKDHKETTQSKLIAYEYDFLSFFDESADLDLVYNVGSRFANTISKERLHNAKSIIDIFPNHTPLIVESYDLVIVSLLEEDQQLNELGKSKNLNKAQKDLLQSTDYSNNIIIKAYYKTKSCATEKGEEYLQYYMTVVPEKEAEFAPGNIALINYLKENSKAETANIRQDKLGSGQISFTVTKKGTLSNINLGSSSGYPSYDKKMLELINSVPGIWIPAQNSMGEKVDQELVFFFGTQGC
jgi:hypothetical protein